MVDDLHPYPMQILKERFDLIFHIRKMETSSPDLGHILFCPVSVSRAATLPRSSRLRSLGFQVSPACRGGNRFDVVIEDVGRASMMRSMASESPRKSGVKTSTFTPSICFRNSAIHSTKCWLPDRPDRPVDRGHNHMAKPQLEGGFRHFSGFFGSSAPGTPPATEQKGQERVHFSPMTRNVAVPLDQQWLRLGQRASSQMVFSDRLSGSPPYHGCVPLLKVAF